ncbi:hypothetical protein [Methanobrevibacter sp.]|uniref:hypothetical protein n=1 Tax=Methanobrevibacter sp. TaxID=66852 RepID=UPI0026E050AC|nr:hypothetical protein [Methanobrevibacter sp.]MDO5860639.1 hypothetical protein [Methanobrevibacter sp.]
MNTDRKLIIAFIAIVIVVLAGVIAFAPHPSEEVPVKLNLTLTNHNFGYFEMKVPDGSNFQIKNNQIEIGKGKVQWQNKGNFSNETDAVAISKGYTDSLIPADMKLVSQEDDLKIYSSQNTMNRLYKVVRNINDVDIIVSGYNLTLIQEMAKSAKLKDTSKLVLKKPVNNTTKTNKTLNKTVLLKTPDKTKTTNKTANVETTTQKATNKSQYNVETTTQNATNKSQYNVETTTQKVANKGEDIYIGGGSFTTGSGLDDKTYAKIYLGKEHAGESVKVRIIYSRDGVNLNHGNLVDATIKSDGYVSIASADAYSKYPDYATVRVYDTSGNLLNTQGIGLNPTSGTQYF